MKPADPPPENDPPDDDNPYRSPGTTRPSRKTEWPAIIARCIGLLLIMWAVFRYFEHGIIEIGLLSLAAMLLAAGSVHDVFFRPNLRQVRRKIKKRMAERSGDTAEPSPPPEEFLRKLENDDR